MILVNTEPCGLIFKPALKRHVCAARASLAEQSSNKQRHTSPRPLSSRACETRNAALRTDDKDRPSLHQTL